jgi:CSLREA domain-containing protein
MRRTLGPRLVVVLLTAVFLTAAQALGPIAPAGAAPIGVTTTADEFTDPGPGAGCSLREAIRAANTDAAYGGCPAGSGADSISLGAATYTLSRVGALENATATGDLDIVQDLAIQGQSSATTTINGGGVDRVFHVDPTFGGASPSLTMSNLTIRGGETKPGSGNGGGIQVEYEGRLSMDRVLITDNEALDTGAGVHADDTAVVAVTNSSISGNRSDNAGGGIGNWSGSVMTLTDTTVNGNTADSLGGGIMNENEASLTLSDSTIGGNASTGGAGGGIVADNDSVIAATNSTISGNRSEEGGGGLFVYATNPGLSIVLTNATVAGNVADSDGNDDGDGGGIFIEPVLDGSVSLRNTLLGDNVDGSPGGGTRHPDCSAGTGDEITSQGHNLIESTAGCAITGTTAGNVTGVDPKLGPLTDNGGPTMTQALLAGSPAVDAADPAGAPPTDQRGVPRNPDIGAYELVRCAGVPVNRVGSQGADMLGGTSASDGFLGLGGNDVVKGLGGNDAACLGGGNDRAAGGGGKDRLLGDQGKDRLKGQGGNDRLRGGPGKDTCIGGPGRRDKAACEVEKQVP